MLGVRIPSVFVLKALFGGVGLSAGIAGMALELRWLVWGAVVLLLVAFLLRFAERKPDLPGP
jgi:hypothetical protein